MPGFLHAAFPEIIRVGRSDTGEATDEIALAKGPYFLPHDEALALIAKLISFYSAHAPAEIDKANAKVEAQHQQLSDIDAMRERMGRESAQRTATERDIKRGPGVVYLFRRADGLIKIGHTRHLSQRKRALRKEHGDLEELALLMCEKPELTEYTLHCQFAEKHIEGEWFSLTPEDVQVVKEM